jgi:hypothetical protein
MISPWIAIASLISAAQVADPATFICRGDRTMQSVTEVYRAYQMRSVEIVRSAMAAERAGLTQLISPALRVTYSRGDHGYGRPFSGPEGVADLFRRISPAEYYYSTPFVGPLSTDTCGSMTVELLLRGPETAAALQFKYEAGILVELSGREVFFTQGQLQPSRSLD